MAARSPKPQNSRPKQVSARSTTRGRPPVLRTEGGRPQRKSVWLAGAHAANWPSSWRSTKTPKHRTDSSKIPAVLATICAQKVADVSQSSPTGVRAHLCVCVIGNYLRMRQKKKPPTPLNTTCVTHGCPTCCLSGAPTSVPEQISGVVANTERRTKDGDLPPETRVIGAKQCLRGPGSPAVTRAAGAAREARNAY